MKLSDIPISGVVRDAFGALFEKVGWNTWSMMRDDCYYSSASIRLPAIRLIEDPNEDTVILS